MEIDGNVLTQSVSDWILFSCVLSYNPSNPNILNKCASAVTKVLNYYRFVSRVVPLSDQLNIQDHAVSGVSHNALLEDRMRLGCSTGALCNNNPKHHSTFVQCSVCVAEHYWVSWWHQGTTVPCAPRWSTQTPAGMKQLERRNNDKYMLLCFPRSGLCPK